MGEALSGALAVRSQAARWLATERLPDWDLFLAVEGEAHGAIEGLWHGLDPSHPLHGHASGPAAGEALTEVHRAVDRMVGELAAAIPDAAIVAFTMGGMGPNHSDVPSMLLLSELLYRRAFGRRLLHVPTEWETAPDALPALGDSEEWSRASLAWVPMPARAPAASGSERWRRAGRRLPRPVQDALRRTRATLAGGRRRRGPVRLDLSWQPAARYQPYWSRMPAFALPSFYDGRIRINLKGRERCGMVAPSDFETVCRDLEATLLECRNPRTGEPAVEEIERASTKDPMARNGSEADLLVIWRGVASAIEHPRLGLIGPVPLRRTGGHTGRYGMAYVQAPGVEPGDRGVRSAFDVVPTLAGLLGDGARVPGRSLLAG
jgi:hypothetical protein